MLVSAALAVLGLNLTTPAAQAATCTGAGCSPAALLNDTLLTYSDTYYATPAEQASLGALEGQAVANTLADHGLPPSDAAAVQSWGREDTEGELWGLMVKAIRTDPASRTPDQQNAVTWMTDVMHRKAEAAALDAGWEFLKWAGHVSSTAPRPLSADILTALQGYANNTLQPVNYMNGSPYNSNSGFCAYRAPVGFDGDYTGNITTPVLHQTADVWCFKPYYCTSILGNCKDNEPSFDAFVKWGEADVTGDPSKDTDFAVMSHGVATGIGFGAAAVGAGVIGAALSASLGPVLTSSALTSALFPYTAAALVDFGGLGATLPAEFAGGLAASAVGAVVSVAIIAIAIAVIEGIQIAANAALPGQLHDLITNAQAGTPDLQAMLADSNQLGGLYGMFVRAMGPAPKAQTCDNSNLRLNADGTAPAPCGNAPAIPGVAGDDPQFLIQPLDAAGKPDSAATHSDTLTWSDGLATGQATTPGWISSARMSGSWFVTSTDSGGATLPTYQTLRIHYISPDRYYTETSWLLKQSDGSYKFLTITGNSLYPTGTVPPAAPLNAPTCLADKTCSLSDSINMVTPDANGHLGPAVQVSVVPPVHPTIAIGHSANPLEGAPVTLTASNTGADVGSLSYTWYVQLPNNSVSACPPAPCGYAGPFTGEHVDYTFTTSGLFHVIVVAATTSGRQTRAETDIDVGDVAPTLTVNTGTGSTTIPDATTLTGSIDHAGSADTETLTIDWGDGSHDTGTYRGGPMWVVNCPCNPTFTATSPTRMDFTATHAYTQPGDHIVKVTVTDQGGGSDSTTISEHVVGPQTLGFPAIPSHVYGDAPFSATVTGGDSGEPVTVASTTTDVCTVTGNAGGSGTTATITLHAAGTCTITADQAGNLDYLPAPEVARTFEVAKAPLTITAHDQTMTLHGAVPDLTVGYIGFVYNDTASVVSGLTCTSNDGTGHPVSAQTPVGSYPITCSGASAANYQIDYHPGTLHVTYTFGGFTGPLARSGVIDVNAGSSLPVQWSLSDAAGVSITDRSSFTSVTVSSMQCGGTPSTGGSPVGRASDLTYQDGVWQYNWKTAKSLAGTCQAMTLHLSDGTAHTALLRFR